MGWNVHVDQPRDYDSLRPCVSRTLRFFCGSVRLGMMEEIIERALFEARVRRFVWGLSRWAG